MTTFSELRKVAGEDRELPPQRKALDGWFVAPLYYGDHRRLDSDEPLTSQQSKEDHRNGQDLTRPKTICLFRHRPEKLRHFFLEPAFGRLPHGSRRMLLFQSPSQGSQDVTPVCSLFVARRIGEPTRPVPFSFLLEE